MRLITESIIKNDEYYELELFHSSPTLKFDAIFNSESAEFGKGAGAMLGKGLYANLDEKQVMKHNYGKYTFKFKLKIPCNKTIIANHRIYNSIYHSELKTDRDVIKEQYKEYSKRYSNEKDRMDWKKFINKGFLMMVYYGGFDGQSIVLWDYKNKDIDIKCTEWKYDNQDWVRASISIEEFENRFEIVRQKILANKTYKEKTFNKTDNIIDYDISKGKKYIQTLNNSEREIYNKIDKLFDGELFVIPDTFNASTTIKLNKDTEYIIFGDNAVNNGRSRISANLTGECKSLSIIGAINIKGDVKIENLIIYLNDYKFRLYSSYQTLFKNIKNLIIDNKNSIFKSINVNKFIKGIYKFPQTFDNVESILFLRNPDDNNNGHIPQLQSVIKDKETNVEINIDAYNSIKMTDYNVKKMLIDKFPKAHFSYKKFYDGILPKFIEKWVKTTKDM